MTPVPLDAQVYGEMERSPTFSVVLIASRVVTPVLQEEPVLQALPGRVVV